MTLHIAPGLDLPDDIVTQPIAILARRGAGKTYTATVLVEEVVRASLPVVVLDPTGAWWGLRSSIDGQSAGLPVVIFGGDHGDVPLQPTAGRVIADVVLEHPGAFIVDLSGFDSKAAEQRFAADFLERLYRGKKRETGPLLLVVDEADVFAPQRPGTEQIRTLGALEAIVRRGRIKGLGDLLISQRAAVLNKNVLTQTEVLVAMQTTGPQDRAAIDDWIAGNGTREERDEVLGSLASLERGEAWVWSPAFLRILQRVRIRARTTFDSSRTPEAGETAITPRAFATVDLEALGAQIAATVEQQKANDPAELRRRIAELERKVADQPAPVVERIEVPVLNGQVDKLAALLIDVRQYGESFVRVGDGLRDIADSITAAIGRVQSNPNVGQVERAPRGVPARPARDRGETAVATLAPAAPSRTPAQSDGTAPLGKAERSVLAVLAQFPAGRTQTQVAILSGYSATSGGFFGTLAKLRRNEHIEGSNDQLRATEAGLAALGPYDPLPTGPELLRYWIGRLSKAEGNILAVLVDALPDSLPQEEVASRTGYSPTSGGFFGALAKLRTLLLISGTKDALRGSEDLV